MLYQDKQGNILTAKQVSDLTETQKEELGIHLIFAEN